MSGGVVTAAGAVLWRRDGTQVAVVHRPRYDDWSLPKGKSHRHESMPGAAAREVTEETGYAVRLGHHLGTCRYPVWHPVPASKVVDFFAAEALAGSFRPGEEVDALRWLQVADAEAKLTYPHERDILRRFTSLPPSAVTPLLLVRHAVAGRKSQWPGEDVLRPLSSRGWRQAGDVDRLTVLFGVDRVHTAVPLRCRQTVEAASTRLGTAPVPEPLLSEKDYVGAEEAAVARLREIAAGGGVPVVCSQGRVIPDLLSRIAGADGLPTDGLRTDGSRTDESRTGGSRTDSLPARKGSTWLLSFAADTTLAGAFHIPPQH